MAQFSYVTRPGIRGELFERFTIHFRNIVVGYFVQYLPYKVREVVCAVSEWWDLYRSAENSAK